MLCLNITSDIPMEILITIGAGIVLLFTLCVVALLVRRKCQQADLNNQAIYNQSTVSSSGRYATTKPHTRSSWTCTYKAGRQHQVDTHIWETPLPEPSADEYTQPTNMRQTQGNTQTPAAMLDSMEYTVPVSTVKVQDGDFIPQAEYTKPVKGIGQRDTEAEYPSSLNNTNNSVQSDKRQSHANYYYYDPSSGEQSEYMAPMNFNGMNPLDSSPAQDKSSGSHDDITGDNIPVNDPVQDIRECDYKTFYPSDRYL